MARLRTFGLPASRLVSEKKNQMYAEISFIAEGGRKAFRNMCLAFFSTWLPPLTLLVSIILTTLPPPIPPPPRINRVRVRDL